MVLLLNPHRNPLQIDPLLVQAERASVALPEPTIRKLWKVAVKVVHADIIVKGLAFVFGARRIVTVRLSRRE